MSRNIKLAAVAVALAGGVYLGGAAPAGASNMGFKLERSFDVIRSGGATGTPLQNKYIVSMPLFNGMGDVADANAAGPTFRSKCVGDTGGPTVGDGTVDSFDALCEFYTARANPNPGQMSLIYWDSANCSPVAHNVSIGFGGALSFSGTPFTLVRDVSYTVIVGVGAGQTNNPVNRVVIVGSHDPSYTAHQLTASTTCGPLAQRLDFINLFYHTMYTHANELLCGLEIVDWVDLTDTAGNPGPDGNPDTCWDDQNGNLRFDAGEPLTGIFDGVHGVSVQYWDNTPGTNGPVPRNVTLGFGGRLSWSGSNYDLVPGEGYIVAMNAGHSSTFEQPHY